MKYICIDKKVEKQYESTTQGQRLIVLGNRLEEWLPTRLPSSAFREAFWESTGVVLEAMHVEDLPAIPIPCLNEFGVFIGLLTGLWHVWKKSREMRDYSSPGGFLSTKLHSHAFWVHWLRAPGQTVLIFVLSYMHLWMTDDMAAQSNTYVLQKTIINYAVCTSAIYAHATQLHYHPIHEPILTFYFDKNWKPLFSLKRKLILNRYT